MDERTQNGENPHDTVELSDEQHGGNTKRRTFMKGIGAAGVAGATGTAGIATQTREAEAVAPLAIGAVAVGLLAVGGVSGAYAESRFNLFGTDPGVAASETSDIALRENQKYILGQTYGRAHQKVLNEAVNFGDSGDSVEVDMKGEYGNSLRTKSLESISESFSADENKSEAYESLKETHREFIAGVEKRVLDNWNFIAQRQQRQIFKVWQKATGDENSNQQVFTNTDYDPFDFSIYTPYGEQDGDQLTPEQMSPHGQYTLATGETYTVEPFIFRSGTVTEGKDTNIVSPRRNDSYESSVRAEPKSVAWTHEPSGTTVNDTPEQNMKTLEDVLLTDGTHDRTPKNQFGTLASSVAPILKVTTSEEIEEPAVTTSVADNIRSFRLLRRMIPAMEEMADKELETFDPNQNSYLDDLYVQMSEGELSPNELLTRQEFSSRTSTESLATSDRIYYGMDWNSDSVTADITRQDDSTVSYTGLMTLSIDNYITEANINNGVPQLPSDGDLRREIDDHIDSEEPLNAEVYIEYDNVDGNTKSATYTAETTAIPGEPVTFDPETHDSVLAGNIQTLNYAQVRVDQIAQGLDIQRRVTVGDTIKVDKNFQLGNDFGNADLISRQINFMSSSDGSTETKNVRDGETATVTAITGEDGSSVEYVQYETFIRVADDPIQDAQNRANRADKTSETVNKVNNYYNENGNLGLGGLDARINEFVNQVQQAIDEYGGLGILALGSGAVLWLMSQFSGGGGGGNAVRHRR